MVIQARNSDVQLLDICTHDLAWGVGGVPEVFPSPIKPFLLNGIADCRRHVMFHVPFEADGGSEHVTVFRHMTDSFARGTLDVW